MEKSPDFKETVLTTEAARWIFVGLITTAISGASFLVWLDNRVANTVRHYANESIYPRIVENERNIKELKEYLESTEHSRNRQYGELKANQEDIKKLLTNR